ncbi:MAG: hypothetical protein ACHQIG_02925 [Acidimicrobiia bacterium]
MCRVQPDVPAIGRAFDYLVPDAAGPHLRVGTVVRVALHGRRVRGWVLDPAVAPDAVDAPTARIQPLLAVSSDGPPADVVSVCEWAAHRWAGPLVTFLRAATAPNVVAPGPVPEPETAVYPSLLGPGHPWVGDALIVVAPTRPFSVRPLLAAEGSTLVLVPGVHEAARVAASLGDDGRDVVLLGGEQAAADLTRAWRRARTGACVVVGGRSAAWAPLPDLATVVVVDEGDEAYDEERAPTWSARDVVVERARRVGASVRLVTPAPTVEAMVAAGEPVARGTSARGGWPRVEVVDVRDQEPGQALLTRELAGALHRALDRGERSVCVLNRRGRARLLACRASRELARCERCGAAVRDVDGRLECGVCGTQRPLVCLHCHATRFRPVKPGVAHVRDDLAALLPRVAVDMVDASTDAVPVAPVVVGTEAALHRVVPSRNGGDDAWPVGLVAFLELDQELLAPRVRAPEQALWLLVRGARLLDEGGGASTARRSLLLQTRVPGHGVVRAVAVGDPIAVTRAERLQRETLGFPPFGGLAALGGDAVAVSAACDALRATGVTVLGPVCDGRRALVRASTWDALADALATPAVDAAHTRGRLRVDVDPRRA